MDCLQSRRSLFAAPRNLSEEHRAHMAACAACARLAQRLASVERDIENAAFVRVPEALEARVLLRRSWGGYRRYALAALLAGVSASAGLLASEIVNAPGRTHAVQAVGPTHPAVVAIAEVENEDGWAPEVTPAEDKAGMERSLRRLGLALKAGEASAYYVGKCRIEGSTECEHIVIRTSDAYANVMLVRHYPVKDRVVVADRQMVALVSPAGDGGYIVVADSEKTARRMEKLIVKG